MKTLQRRLARAVAMVGPALIVSACSTATGQSRPDALVIQEQGSFAAGGTVIRGPDGRTLHGDHAQVFYQRPPAARKLPLVLWHGAGQSSKTWESTPDGREGFQNLFLRRGFSVYVVDQPRRGAAGRSTQPATITPTPDDQFWFNQFRVGVWPDRFPGVQFSANPEALNQYFRQMTPNTGPFDMEVISDAAAALFKRIGPGILVTHSQGGGPGWLTVMKSTEVRAVVSYEPGSNFVFPQGKVPSPMKSAGDTLEAVGVPLEQFMRLTRIPIVIYYGDNIPQQPVAAPNQDSWRTRLAMARLWAEAVNRRGGDVTVVHLPEIGICGNTHFPFSDLNNVEIANHLAGFLAKKGLD